VATFWKSSVWQQFGAAIDMLRNAIVACPEELWSDRSERPELWYTVYHTLFWLDLYLTGSLEGFAPPAPFTLGELEADVMPDRVYTKDELLAYLEHCRQKCRATIEALTVETADRRPSVSRVDSFLELLLYNMRHVQEHNAQLGLVLGQKIGWEADWVAKARP
jgi:hypothetical protein